MWQATRLRGWINKFNGACHVAKRDKFRAPDSHLKQCRREYTPFVTRCFCFTLLFILAPLHRHPLSASPPTSPPLFLLPSILYPPAPPSSGRPSETGTIVDLDSDHACIEFVLHFSSRYKCNRVSPPIRLEHDARCSSSDTFVFRSNIVTMKTINESLTNVRYFEQGALDDY